MHVQDMISIINHLDEYHHNSPLLTCYELDDNQANSTRREAVPTGSSLSEHKPPRLSGERMTRIIFFERMIRMKESSESEIIFCRNKQEM